jgi:hypothetical protein
MKDFNAKPQGLVIPEDPAPLTCKIKQITQQSELILQFNRPLVTPSIYNNITEETNDPNYQ